MEPLINLHYLQQICFGDNSLVREMLDEWKIDTHSKLDEFNKVGLTSKQLFTIVHNLKTNFFMIGCSPGIRACEQFLLDKNQNVKPKILSESLLEYLKLIEKEIANPLL